MAIHYFHTTGAVTAAFPTAAQIDSTSTSTTGTYSSSYFQSGDVITLLEINVLTAPGSADTIIFTDKAGAAITGAFAVPTSIATFNRPRFPGNGLPVPKGGFGVTTTAASSVYQFIFDVQKSIA